MNMMYTEFERDPLLKIGHLSVYVQLCIIRNDIELNMADRDFLDIDF